MKTGNLITLSLVALSLAIAGPLAAQDYQAPAQQETVEVSDRQLEKFVDAQASIVEIQQDFSARLEQVDDPDRAHQLQVEANEEMTSAVREAGLDVESYNAIAIAIQNDPELQERLGRLIHQ